MLLFHNLFELEPRLRQLFPFKTGDGHIADKVRKQLSQMLLACTAALLQSLSSGAHGKRTTVLGANLPWA